MGYLATYSRKGGLIVVRLGNAGANCAQTLSGGTGISGGAPTIRSFGWNEGSELEPNMTWIRVSNRDVTDKKTHRTWENHKGIGGGRFEVFDGLEDSKLVVSFT